MIDKTVFPASKKVPGQTESRTAYAQFNEDAQEYPWYALYMELRLDGWDWRKAVLIAWLSMPKGKQKPEYLYQLAENVLVVQPRTVRKWRQDDPNIDETVGRYQARPLLGRRADVFEALGEVASMPDPKAHRDRKLFLEMTGDYNPKALPVQVMPELDELEPDELEYDQSAEILSILDECGARPATVAPGVETEANKVHSS